ncbi:UDP-N-acetylmuramoyl-L-alanyl-D-glutamate--2,6-diaminopimelate ligase [Thalassotalea insulae]|uniref:UDP-N-acetylmuramoyl-L-alanyl-D-glutamate--2,6-diaminopimelate ligase n=1 Tax=Thalassotalea insulae TaxID=2056778 RepID=A0ABQ6GPE1_9GAMM|nr:UDP-N-acetylmuramoyl-L-alanyl-D-glutamate--2,6-diaminopimelate ligase [Thalassotalea insulae]GLX77802.1 UDP-N-acetylmuramoyl-L-alanyl-D-glutamate--2,6-diaminopimelate ligase [Thalassotalea insulae]
MFSSNGKTISKWLAPFGIDLELSLSEQVRHLVNDSRELSAGDIFCGVNGTANKGRDFIAQALAADCHLILVECQHSAQHGTITTKPSTSGIEVAIIEFYQLNQQLFTLASAFYFHPHQQLMMIGITGTNGKTTTSQLIAKLLSANNQPCSVIGTNGAGQIDQLTAIKNTTPGATELMRWLQQFTEQQQSAVAMEVSSHALVQARVQASLFDVAVFTNLSRDHLDYHQSMENYAEAKFQIFSDNGEQIAVVNGDDQTAQVWLTHWHNKKNLIVYGRSETVKQYQQFVYAGAISHQHSGVTFTLSSHLGEVTIHSQLIGDFNVDNLLAAIAVLIHAKVSLSDIAISVKSLTAIPGRMEAFSRHNAPLAVVDYAHTPDGLENALKACRQHCQGQLWVVFGCGGDRDRGKRPLMGKIAEIHSDQIIITNDNPRTESPEQIVKDVLAGCQQPEKINVMLERQQAVLAALTQAKPDDVVLLAGKGHEDYVIIGDQQLTYNERELVRSTYAHGALS